jgi:type 1 glutamine amidotransferase
MPILTKNADKAKHKSASGENEPMLMTIAYGKGRVLHRTLGHVGPQDVEPTTSANCVGFMTLLQRGTEWAATGKVTLAMPVDFPKVDRTSVSSAK